MQIPATTSSSAWLRGVVQMFASQGVDAARLFEQAGIDIARLHQPHMRFDPAEVGRLWALAVAASGNTTLGIDRQLAARYINFEFATQAMWPSHALQGGLESLARYLHLTGDFASFTIEPQLGGTWLALEHGKDPATPRQRIEFGLLVLLTLCRRVTRKPLRPLAAEFAHPDPGDYHPYRMAFACPLRFGQAANRLLLSEEDMALPLATSEPSPFAAQERVMEERLARLGRARHSWRVSEELIRRLHLGEPRASQIARSLSLSEAALHQRLRAEGTSFERLLEEVRHDLATHYLREPAYPLAQLPALLGFATASAPFEAACKRWFGLAPAACRQLLAAERVDP